MNEIFGLSMDTLMVVIIVLLGLIALSMGYLALRNPLFFRLGLRNIPRRRAQTLLIIFGLMLSTLIVSSAFTTGDTLSTSLRSQAIEITGHVDHLVQYETTPGRNVSQAESVVPQRVADDLKTAFAGDERIVGFIRALNDTASIRNIDSGQQLALSYLLGLDPAEADAIGGIPGADGSQLSLTGTGADGIILNATAAQELAAQPGHEVLVRARGVEHPFRVAGIAKDTLVSGEIDLLNPQGGVIRLGVAQEIFGQPGALDAVGVAVVGGETGALELSGEIDDVLNRFLVEQAEAEVAAGVPLEERVYADRLDRHIFESTPLKEENVAAAELFGSLFTSLFLVMGLFSIAAGILLIFLIFVLLAEERKSEMGIARAVGMRRGHLVQAYLAEGLAYNVGAAAVGTLLGIAVAFLMVGVLNSAFDAAWGFTFDRHVEPRSIVVAAGLGIVLTFITVAISAFRVSVLNIVAAIRDIPEGSIRERRPISISGLVTTPLGLALLWTTPFTLAGGGLLAGAAAGARPRAAGRLALHAGLAADAPPPGMVADLHAGRRLHDHRAQRRRLGLRLPGRPDAGAAGPAADGAALRRGAHRRAGAAGVVGEAGAAGPGPPPLGGADRRGLAAATAGAPLSHAGPHRAHGRQRGRAVLLVRGRLVPRGHPRRQRRGRAGAVLPLRRGDGHGGRDPGDREPRRLRAAAAGAGGVDRAAAAGRADGGRLSRDGAVPHRHDHRHDRDHHVRAGHLHDDQRQLRAALHQRHVGRRLRPRGRRGPRLGHRRPAGRAARRRRRRPAGATRGREPAVLRQRQRHRHPARRVAGLRRLHQELVPGPDGQPYFEPAEDAGLRQLFLAGADDGFLAENGVVLQARAFGYASDRAVWEALRAPGPDGERYAVITATAVAQSGGFAPIEETDFKLPDTIREFTEQIPQVTVRLSNSAREAAEEVTIIGIIDQVVGIAAIVPGDIRPTLITHEDVVFALYESADTVRHFARSAPGFEALDTAQAVEAALQLETQSIKDELEQQQDTFNAILGLFQGFTAMGLVAGLAALGVLAVRAVVERRQQIGVLRAIGFRAGYVRLGLMLEMGFISLIGLLLGGSLALVLSWRLFEEGVFGSTAGADFYIPVGRLLLFFALAIVATIVLTYLPARQASTKTVAESLRYE